MTTTSLTCSTLLGGGIFAAGLMAGGWFAPTPHKGNDIHNASFAHFTPTNASVTRHFPAAPSSNSGPEESTSFVEATEASVHAVVHVQTSSLVPDASNPWLSMLGMAQGRLARGSGSGVVIDRDGLIVTNHHVIQGAQDIQVSLSDGTSCQAQLIGSDPSTDLALLQITPPSPLVSLEFGNSDNVRVGQWVLAVGNPLNLTSTVTAGIVSAKGRNIRLLESDASRDIYPVESFLQTDAAVNPGNSGGALVNLNGELIGINTAIASQTGSYAGYSFAIPSSIVAKVAKDLKEFGRVQRAYLGIQIDPRRSGVTVAMAHEGGGAGAAGVRAGDEVVAVNGFDVKSFPALQEQLSKHRPGDDVVVTVKRGAALNDIPVTLTDRAGFTTTPAPKEQTAAPQAAAKTGSTPRLPASWGVKLEPLSPQKRQQLRLKGGVTVSDMTQGEWAQQGLRKGFILLRIDGSPVQDVADVLAATAKAERDRQDGVLLEGIYLNGERAFAGVAVP